MIEPDAAGVELLGVRFEDRLEADLWQVRRRARTGVDVLRITVARTPDLELPDLAPGVRVAAL